MLEGIITAMVTPVDESGKINQTATCQLIDRLIENGIHGLFILGTNGEFHRLSKQQKKEFMKIVVEYTNKRVPVYAGTGGNCTEEVIQMTKSASEIGVDAVSVITPYLLALTEEELYQHYKKIADASSVPVILYNIPKNTGNALSPYLVSRLSKLPNIIGIKDSSGDLENLRSYIDETAKENFSVLVGSDSLILEALKIGATGAVAATSNVLTKTDLLIYQLWKAGDLAQAEKVQKSIDAFRAVLKFGTVPSVLKLAITNTGIDVGSPIAPVLPLKDKKQLEKVKQVLASYEKTETIG
ncbi:dihydrodipicolinate synthase [Enterococcus phoeniculicola]|jgi:4-hydroxy-tetrahydrodipicolinate synthase|uniref:4-hydroxy-tetrahydrodipicolinate synthase n=1 Tax=Enterococcus phoeniculicola ATCC BAA-412 TaxID=1158610 RepID=R3TJQ8_9ENTE|nr:4-hydroxy-tetrahydrodipicolinate synthase [Enterococcus phoeniculicola]EOL41654.1 dihydrodipicolinate synthase [Enterococcus phoeniculicola ATCC BAA-412]EOT78852.1 dihydrodipicolinate synthase [Enterococcus phoeniculicola ATCC BAA-412]OJG72684.1 dihydrodipicolinate synthase [Enterococcus phoeniculicola]